jgi:hypothetical protein
MSGGPLAELTFRLLTSRQTAGTLRPMDVFHVRGQHSEAHLLDSPANNCDRDNAERVLRPRVQIFPGGLTPTHR